MNSEINRKRIIFSITTGRSGTQFLANLCKAIPGAVSLHEPQPNFQDCLHFVKENNGKAVKEFWQEEKLPFIDAQPGQIYIETSHVFGKGFLEPLLHLGVVPDLIILKRNPSLVAKSLYRIGTIPGMSDAGIKYLISPNDYNFLPLENWSTLHPYQLCYWYAVETCMRQSFYKELIQALGGRFVELNFEDLNKITSVIKIAKQLNLPKPSFLKALKFSYRSRGFKNEKRGVNRELENGLDYNLLESELLNKVNPVKGS